MIKYLIIVFSVSFLFVNTLLAQSDNSEGAAWNLGLNAGIGFIMPHHPNMVLLQQDHVKTFELFFEKNTNGSKYWHTLYNYPLVGFSYQYFNLGADEYLGNAHALNIYLKVDIIKGKHIGVFIRPTFGLGHVDKVYDSETNNKNISMSTKLNALIQMQAGVHTHFNSRINFNSNLNFIHFSNGAITKPNQGINMPVLSFGAKYGLGTQTIIKKNFQVDFEKKWHYWIAASATVKQLYPPGGANYAAYILTAGRYKEVNPILEWGYGIDLTYDNSIKEERNRENMPSDDFIHATRGGAHLGMIMNVNNFGALVNAGGYIFNHSPDNYFLYTKLGIRVKFNEKLFTGVNLKTHFAKADLLEWHLGWKFKKDD